MSKKVKFWLYFLEVIIILIIVFYLAITKYWPEYQESLGSSEKLFSATNYYTGIEVKVTTGPAFFLVINKEEIVTNIFLENAEAGSLANQGIEGKNLKTAISSIIQNLIDNNKIIDQPILMINYNDETIFNKAVSSVQETLTENKIALNLIKSTSTLTKKAEEENLEQTEQSEILWALYLNSMEIIDDIPTTEQSPQQEISKEAAENYTDTIYQKLITYMMNANVENQQRNDPIMPIQYIPGDTANTIYPTSDSWYYIENYNIYAQISIDSTTQRYTFCYQGTIENKKEGICS